jgi:hypothetical protein
MGEHRQDRADTSTETAPVSTAERRTAASWVSEHKWAVGSAVVAAVLGGGLWWRRRQRRRIALAPMSDTWLQHHEYESGQRQSE